MRLSNFFPNLNLKQTTFQITNSNLTCLKIHNNALLICSVDTGTEFNLTIPDSLPNNFLCFLILGGKNLTTLNLTTTLTLFPSQTTVTVKNNQKVFIQKTETDVYVLTELELSQLVNNLVTAVNPPSTTDDLPQGSTNLYMDYTDYSSILSSYLDSVDSDLGSINPFLVTIGTAITNLNRITQTLPNTTPSQNHSKLDPISVIAQNNSKVYLKSIENLENISVSIYDGDISVVSKTVETDTTYNGINYSIDLTTELEAGLFQTDKIYRAEILNDFALFKTFDSGL